jgi:cyclopropane fatty-acyl-phospholipid synthase-like methyltransferase
MAIVNALPLKTGARVLEIGCGPGATAREIASGRLSLRQVAIEDFELAAAEAAYEECSANGDVSMPLKQMPFGKVFGIRDPAGQPTT